MGMPLLIRRSRSLLLSLMLILFAALLASAFAAPARAATARPPVVLVHGTNGGPQITWATTIAAFEQAGYQSGSTLFAIDLSKRTGEEQDLSLLADTAYVADEVRKIMANTGAAQVDVVGHSRGGLIVRLLATGETASLVHRAVTLDTPHAGVLSREQMAPLFKAANLDPAFRALLGITSDVEVGSATISTMLARERRFADRRVPALAVASTWREGVPAFLAGHDGVVSVASQLAWPGAATFTARLGPAPDQLAGGIDMTVLDTNNPHVQSHESAEVFTKVLAFLQAPDAPAPARACEPACADFAALKGHWAEAEISPFLRTRLPYAVDSQGQLVFEANRPMTRAEFIYGLVKSLGLTERLGATTFADMRGHWALGYVEAATQAGLVKGITPDAFGPDEPLSRAAAATLVVRAKALATSGQGSGASRFADTHGHWAEAYIDAAADAGIVKGDGGTFRPDASMTMAEG
ncbi:MAG: alpha amylase, partial [Firmicutes bacterium]|nr:alpha amylase [Bacillota bacterium]